jgi:hypothetical protein
VLPAAAVADVSTRLARDFSVAIQ